MIGELGCMTTQRLWTEPEGLTFFCFGDCRNAAGLKERAWVFGLELLARGNFALGRNGNLLSGLRAKAEVTRTSKRYSRYCDMFND